ncbi:MAG: response regulator [Planctomycetes bacterium]|nr:response regulator [Planctomycetota bacterium]
MARILIVDDDEAIRALIRHILEPLGLSISEASNGREGFRRATRDEYDLILVDIRMPDWGGFEAIRSIEIVRPKTRFLVISAYIDDDARRQLAEVDSVLACLDKPFDVEELGRIIEKVVRPD